MAFPWVRTTPATSATRPAPGASPVPRRRPAATPAVCTLCAAASVLGCGQEAEVVFVPLQVGFERAESTAGEAEERSEVRIVLSAPAPSQLTLELQVTEHSASGHDQCGTRDFSVPERTVTIERGETEASVEIRHLDDQIAEIDEQLSLTLSVADGSAELSLPRHTHLILDDDRTLLADVREDFGAAGDGSTDDTDAIQRAIDRAALNAGAVVYLPPGTYVVTTVALPAGVNVFGYDAILTRAPNQPTDQRTLVFTYGGDTDSPLSFIQGLTFDGNRNEQAGGFEDWEYRNADLFYARGAAAQPGRLRFIAEDLTFQNTGASGLLMETNIDATLCSIIGNEVFTDVLHLLGGNSTLRVHSLSAGGSTGTTGVAIKGSQLGFGDSHRLDVELRDLALESGDLQISLDEASVLTGENITVSRAPLYIRAKNSSVTLRNSSFVVGPALFEFNRIVAPSSVTFEDTTFVITENPEPTVVMAEADREIRALDVVWSDTTLALTAGEFDLINEVVSDQELICTRCTFESGDDVDGTDDIVAVGTTLPTTEEPMPQEGDNNRIVLRAPTLGSGMDALFSNQCTGCVRE